MKNQLKTAVIATAATVISSNAAAHSGGLAATHEMEHALWLIIPVVAIAAGMGRWLLQANRRK